MISKDLKAAMDAFAIEAWQDECNLTGSQALRNRCFLVALSESKSIGDVFQRYYELCAKHNIPDPRHQKEIDAAKAKSCSAVPPPVVD